MDPCRNRIAARLCLVIVAFAGSFITACGDGGEKAAAGAAQKPPAKNTGAPPAAKAAPPQLKACSVVTKEDVERLTARKVLDPVEETVAELSTCSFGDPASPKVGGRSLSRPVTVSVFTGGNNYYAGPVAQTSEVFEMAVRNAGPIEPVSGLGDKAHWAGRTLRILRGPYLVEVEVDVGDASRTIAEKLAAMAVGRLP